MRCFSTLSSAALVLLAAAQTALATPQPLPLDSLTLHLRSKTDGEPDIVPQCATTCNQLQDTLLNTTSPAALCSQSVMSMFETCFDCEVGAGRGHGGQPPVTEFVAACNLAKLPVKNFTVKGSKKNGAPQGAQVPAMMLAVSGVLAAGLGVAGVLF
ncbi:hypothetical protein MIND_00407500 [Mycena indigotica]|uniref:Uncharacterized protein n=1 Tax=Mycena indigotica TaxID=2126181 RepID=A0A8H6W953_9AGAR|nr:uncharacterized protein MIND_00407500 [Mycena indigotica]KAF7310334.1 hypothetical protein MIND_00407500 [Mycena indigotica]